jgi:hypothetical protein
MGSWVPGDALPLVAPRNLRPLGCQAERSYLSLERGAIDPVAEHAQHAPNVSQGLGRSAVSKELELSDDDVFRRREPDRLTLHSDLLASLEPRSASIPSSGGT